jgi:hypothetical protein
MYVCGGVAVYLHSLSTPVSPINLAMWILESVQRLLKRDKSGVPVGY